MALKYYSLTIEMALDELGRCVLNPSLRPFVRDDIEIIIIIF